MNRAQGDPQGTCRTPSRKWGRGASSRTSRPEGASEGGEGDGPGVTARARLAVRPSGVRGSPQKRSGRRQRAGARQRPAAPLASSVAVTTLLPSSSGYRCVVALVQMAVARSALRVRIILLHSQDSSIRRIEDLHLKMMPKLPEAHQEAGGPLTSQGRTWE